MADNQILDGIVDMSSNDPHVTVQCPICRVTWMKKVELYKPLVSPCACAIEYVMAGTINTVKIEMRLNAEQTKLYKRKLHK